MRFSELTGADGSLAAVLTLASIGIAIQVGFLIAAARARVSDVIPSAQVISESKHTRRW